METRRRFRGLVTTALALALIGVARATPLPADPFLWLEDVHGKAALAWVAREDARTSSALERVPVFPAFERESLAIVQAKDRLPVPSMIVANRVYNFRQDAVHIRGIWRRTSLAEYAKTAPAWQTVLDLDALAKRDKKNWVWAGADCGSASETRCLVSLSDGGEDAVTIREFDLTTSEFVPGGFVFPHGKQNAAWVDDDTILLSREWKPGEMTASGYAYVVKRVVRGVSLDRAVDVARGLRTDVSAGAASYRDADGHHIEFFYRGLSFFESKQSLLTPAGLVDLPLPKKSSFQAFVAGRLLLKIDEPWTVSGATFPAGALLSLDAGALRADPAHPAPTLVYAAGPRETLESVSQTRDSVLVTMLDNVRGRANVYAPGAGETWTKRPLALPDNSSIGVTATDDRGTTAILSVSGFLTPTTLWAADLERVTGLAVLKTATARFDASRDVVEQREAISTDGTHVPYFFVHRRDRKLDGTTPTILEAYGGFAVSSTPGYSGLNGKLWLERGGSYALANIRGGGEFGPAWHEAGLNVHRQRVFDDFAAVARDLIARKATSPRRLGIEGASNGGLLMGVEFVQHPDLFHAVDIGVPLLDMLRFEKIAAGASWVGEYGSVTVPAQRAFLEKISPYANLRAGVAYPEPFVWTTTKDDRVGPQHARKFAARLAALHDPYLFFEQTEGGHGAGANLKEDAHFYALEYAYFWDRLVL